MKKLSGIAVPALIAALVFFSPLSCSREREDARHAAPSAPASEVAQTAGERAPDADITVAERGKTADSPSNEQGSASGIPLPEHQIQTILQRPMTGASDRFLEYSVTLRYRTADFRKARHLLLDVISRYGFLRSGSTDLGDASVSEMSIHASVSAANLYKFLREIDPAGELVSERINVSDLTETLVLAQRAQKREDIRIGRRNLAMGTMAPQARSWQAIEQSLTRSEDALDQAEHRRWQVLDRVSWAHVAISLEPLGEIKVPPYRRALYWLAQITLELLYGFIYFIPVLVVILLVRWQWKRIYGWIRRNQKIS